MSRTVFAIVILLAIVSSSILAACGQPVAPIPTPTPPAASPAPQPSPPPQPKPTPTLSPSPTPAPSPTPKPTPTSSFATAQAAFESGILKLKNDNFVGAYTDFSEAVKLDPKMEIASLAKSATTKLMTNDLEGVITDLSGMLKLDPKLATGYYIRSQAAFALYDRYITRDQVRAKTNYDMGMSDINQAITLDDKNADAYRIRAWYMGVNYYTSAFKIDYQAALKDANKAIELDPKLASAYNCRACLYIDMGNKDLAIKDFDKLIELSGDKPPAYGFYNRGLLYLEKTNLDLALADFNKAIEIDAKYWRAYYQRAYIYSQKQQYDPAIADLNKVISNSTETTLVTTAKDLLSTVQRKKGS